MYQNTFNLYYLPLFSFPVVLEANTVTNVVMKNNDWNIIRNELIYSQQRDYNCICFEFKYMNNNMS